MRSLTQPHLFGNHYLTEKENRLFPRAGAAQCDCVPLDGCASIDLVSCHGRLAHGEYVLYQPVPLEGGMLRPKTFAWFSNYVELFQSPDFYNAVGLSAIQVLVVLPFTMIPAFALGYFLSLRRPGYRVLRVIFFSPALISTAVRAMMFYGIFLPDGLLNGLLRLIGLSQFTHLWIGETETALLSIILIDIWGGIGYNAVLIFTFLSGVSQELYEAAQLDGAGPWACMWKIAFPVSLEFFGILTMPRVPMGYLGHGWHYFPAYRRRTGNCLDHTGLLDV